MTEWLNGLGGGEFVTAERILSVVRALAAFVVGVLIARLVASAAARAVEGRLGRQESILTRRFVYYGLLALAVAVTLNQLGFHLGVLLGAAGVLSVALGFASQTSASNLISGLFLIAERPFVIGDIVTVDNVSGEVLSVDLLSVKIRTFDNLFVRIPNESIIKSRLTNVSHFPIRRLDLPIDVAYRSDLERVRDVLMAVAEQNPAVLEDPEPLVIFQAFGESGIRLQFSVWCTRDQFLSTRNSVLVGVKEALAEAGIEIPFPHRVVVSADPTRER